MTKESNLADLKKEYKKLEKKYNLPEFDKLNQDFQVEKACENESDYPIREIRRLVADKLAGYMRFLESMINPINVPMFVFSIVKILGTDEKKRLTEVYKELAKNEVRLVEVDTDFSEKKEAEFIKDSYKLWQGIKKDILGVLDVIKKNWDNKFEPGKKGYFG